MKSSVIPIQTCSILLYEVQTKAGQRRSSISFSNISRLSTPRTLGALTRLVQLAFWSSRSFQRLQDAAPAMRAITATVDRDERTRALLTQLYVYLLRSAQPEVEVEDVRTILQDVAGPQGKEDVVNAAEQLIEQGRAEGLERGLEGLRAGIVAALSARAVPLSEVGRARLASCTTSTRSRVGSRAP